MALLYDDFIEMMGVLTNPEYSLHRFDLMMESDGDYTEDDKTVSFSKIASIRRFYENTNEYNRYKIKELINNSMDNIDKAHKIVLDYEKSKQQ